MEVIVHTLVGDNGGIDGGLDPWMHTPSGGQALSLLSPPGI